MVFWIIFSIVGFLGLIRWQYARIYDVIIVHMTKYWYKAVFEDIDSSSTVIDIGIGTGKALIENKNLVLSKSLTIVGVDYDKIYINAAKDNLVQSKLDKKVTVHCMSIYDEDLVKVVGSQFDVAYFSGSWSLMPNPVAAVEASMKLLSKTGKRTVYITQTFKENASFFMRILKPCLRYLTTIDFGPVTTITQMEEYLNIIKSKNPGVTIERKEIIQPYYSTFLIKLKCK